MFCMKCLKEKVDHQIKIGEMGYGSGFDNFSTQIDLCDECYKKINKQWWDLEIVPCDEQFQYEEIQDIFMKYKYENEIFEYVKNMPLEGREKFWNTYSNECHMISEDWIAYEKGELSYEKCKGYGMHSPQEISAYEDRFPICDKVKIRVHSDSSRGSKCFKGAFGDNEGKCGLNISNECYVCDSFSERDGNIDVIDTLFEYHKRETERCNDMIQYANERLRKLEGKK